MFDLGASELLLIVVVAILVIGPKDMPMALRTAGRWIGKFRRLSSHFRTGLDAMIREAEMEDMEQKWKAQNEKIMREHPQGAIEMERTGALPAAASLTGKGSETLPEASPGQAEDGRPASAAPPGEAGGSGEQGAASDDHGANPPEHRAEHPVRSADAPGPDRS